MDTTFMDTEHEILMRRLECEIGRLMMDAVISQLDRDVMGGMQCVLGFGQSCSEEREVAALRKRAAFKLIYGGKGK